MEEQDLQNAYQAPKAQHLDSGTEPCQPRVFSFSGRIGRARYVAYTWWATFVVLFFSGLLMALLGGLSVGLLDGLDSPGAMNEALFFPWMFAIGVLTYVPMLVMAKRRLNDLNLAGWFAILIFAPVINVFFMLYLLLWPGEKSANRFGPPPVTNGILVLVFGVGVPLLMFLGFVFVLLVPLMASEALWMQP